MTREVARQLVSRCAQSDSSGGTDVVYTMSYASWQAAWRRGCFMPEDRLALSLLASPRVGRLLVCNHARSVALKLLRALTRSDRAPFPRDERTWLAEPLRLRRRDPTSIRGVRRDVAAYERTIERTMRRYGLHDPIVITAHPLLAGFGEFGWARSVTWYAIDDWAVHPVFRRWWPAYRESYDLVRQRGRRVAAVSSPLLESLGPTGPSAVVRNGLDPAEWTMGGGIPAWGANLPRPLMVYAGRLDHRIDIAWLRSLALAEPSATIALLGGHDEPAHLAPLRRFDNVVFAGMLPRAMLAAILRSADVALLPHVPSPLTAAMNPLKLYEYLAAGLPVAATDLPAIREVEHSHIVLVPPGGDYVGGVRQALATGRLPEADRLQFIERNSWRSRHEHLLDLAIS